MQWFRHVFCLINSSHGKIAYKKDFVQDVFWTSYARSIYVLRLRGSQISKSWYNYIQTWDSNKFPLIAGVIWAGTGKVTDSEVVSLSLYLMIMYKSNYN